MIKLIKSKIQSSIKTKKINVFLLFLALAFGILLLTKLSKSYTNTFVFDIDKINIPEEEVILNDDSQKLEITIKTFGFELLSYYLSKPKLQVDFSKQIDKTDSTYIWTKNKAFAALNNQFNKNIEILNIAPDSLWFKYDVNAVKMIPVELLSTITYSPGYNLSNELALTPDSIKVIGAESILDRINRIQSDTLKMDDVKQDVLKVVDLKLDSLTDVLKFSNKQITVSAKVEKHTEGTLSIPVDVINIPKGIKLRYFPKSVSVSYYVSLANFNTIEANDFKVACDFEKLKKGQTFLVPEMVKTPQTVKHTKINQEYIEFIITE